MSREGLGGPEAVFFEVFSYISFDIVLLVDVLRDAFQPRAIINTFQPVSYTHLTLPTT